MPTDDSFQYLSTPQPAPVKSKKGKYRDDSAVPLNIMADPRVVRGSTTVLAKKIAQASSNENRNGDGNNGTMSVADRTTEMIPRPTYSFEVKPYSGPDMDLLPFLTAADDKDDRSHVNAGIEISSQTDAFLKRPITPDYVPRKTGVDISTQVEDVRELFMFDREVQPIVDVIVAKTLDQALFEVMSEEELGALSSEATKYANKNIEEANWMKEREKHTKMEIRDKARKLDNALLHRADQIRVINYIAGIQMVGQIMPDILRNVSENLYNNGTWDRPEVVTVERFCLQPCVEETKKRHKVYLEAQKMVDELMDEAHALYDKAPLYVPPELPRQIVLRLIMKSQAAEGEGEGGDGSFSSSDKQKILGPFRISNLDTIQSIDKMIKAALKERNINLEFKSVKEYIVASAGRNVADDACVCNFPTIPDDMTIVL